MTRQTALKRAALVTLTAFAILVAVVTYIGHVANSSYARGYADGAKDALMMVMEAQKLKGQIERGEVIQP